jgi:hypothetical protein
MHAARAVSGPILWANLHLLFWLHRGTLLPSLTFPSLCEKPVDGEPPVVRCSPCPFDCRTEA